MPDPGFAIDDVKAATDSDNSYEGKTNVNTTELTNKTNGHIKSDGKHKPIEWDAEGAASDGIKATANNEHKWDATTTAGHAIAPDATKKHGC